MNTSRNNQRKSLVRGAVLLAIAICFQGLRLVFPLPPLAGMFIIGSLVNMTLVIAVRSAGIKPTLLISFLLPIIAFFQGQLAVPIFIPVVALGNMVFVFVCQQFWQKKLLWLAPVFKAAILYVGTLLVLYCFAIPEKVAQVLLLMMSWPQIVTGIIGLMLARQLVRRLAWFG